MLIMKKGKRERTEQIELANWRKIKQQIARILKVDTIKQIEMKEKENLKRRKIKERSTSKEEKLKKGVSQKKKN